MHEPFLKGRQMQYIGFFFFSLALLAPTPASFRLFFCFLFFFIRCCFCPLLLRNSTFEASAVQLRHPHCSERFLECGMCHLPNLRLCSTHSFFSDFQRSDLGLGFGLCLCLDAPRSPLPHLVLFWEPVTFSSARPVCACVGSIHTPAMPLPTIPSSIIPSKPTLCALAESNPG